MNSFSVIIPLYNKAGEVGRALRSALGQTLAPLEIIVVDDGSTDGSAAAVEAIMTRPDCLGPPTPATPTPPATPDTPANHCEPARRSNPEIKLIRQPNAGVSAARNRAMSEASGEWFAFLDADDEWQPGFLAEIAALAAEFPGCGLYSTGFDIVGPRGAHPAQTLQRRGVVDDFFGASMSACVSRTSASAVPRRVVEEVGGFPEGMSLGEDQYMWTKIALRHPVCVSPARLMRYYMEASNRSAAIYTPEKNRYSFSDFYDENNPALNEYIARIELGRAITASARGGTDEGRKAERATAYNRLSRRLWWRLWLLNRLPAPWRPAVNGLYSRLAWAVAKKSL